MLTVRRKPALAVVPPPDPVTLTRVWPFTADGVAVRVIVTVPPTVILGEKVAVTPAGRPEVPRVTTEENPPKVETVTGISVLPVALTVALGTMMENPGVSACDSDASPSVRSVAVREALQFIIIFA